MGSASLMVVEDNAEIRAALRDLFTLEGFAVDEACNGLDALERLDAGTEPSLIVLDLVMPVMDGWEFLRRIQQRPERTTPVVVLTSLSYDADTRGLQERYGVRVLSKSLDIAPLIDLAREHRRALEDGTRETRN